MRPSDFLQKEAATSLCEHYMVAGAICSLSTNQPQLLDAARQSFLPLAGPASSLDFSLRLWVDPGGGGRPPWPQPYVRGLDHLVYAGFDEQSSMLADLRSRRVIGRFSSAMASDAAHWRNVIFPILMSILAGSIGVVETHASCVAKDDQGLVLIGPTRSGKSTLAMALTEAGFRLLSDDRTFFRINQGKMLAYGLPRPLKLRREAAPWFEGLRDQEPTNLQGGERVFHCEPNQRFAQRPSPTCEPRALIVLERQEADIFSMTRARRSDVRSRIEADLLAEAPEDIEKQKQILEGLLALPCWRLQYGGRPQVIAEQVATLIFDNSLGKDAESRTSGGAV